MKTGKRRRHPRVTSKDTNYAIIDNYFITHATTAPELYTNSMPDANELHKYNRRLSAPFTHSSITFLANNGEKEGRGMPAEYRGPLNFESRAIVSLSVGNVERARPDQRYHFQITRKPRCSLDGDEGSAAMPWKEE